MCLCFLIPKSRHLQYDCFFHGGPRCHIDTCYLYPNEDVFFGILKSKSFFNMTLFEEGSRCQTKSGSGVMIYVYTHTHTYILYVCIYIYIYIYIYILVSELNIRIRKAHTHLYTYIHIYIRHIYIHTYMHIYCIGVCLRTCTFFFLILGRAQRTFPPSF
jgi:hypothetical protein